MALLKIICEFSSAPSEPVVTILPKKYGKEGYVCIEFDDGSGGAEILKDAFSTFTHTDGCGNDINYKGGLAVNGAFEEGQPGYDSTYITPARLIELIHSGWDVINHSYTHGGNPSRTADLTDLEASLLRATGYVFNGIVVPGSDAGFVDAGKDLLYGYADSQNGSTFDSVDGTHEIWPDALGDSPEFFAFTRDFNDDWTDPQQIDYLKGEYDRLFTERNFHVEGTHNDLKNPDNLAGLLSVFEYLRTISADRIAVGSMREFVEYRQMRHCPISQSLVGNTLTIEVNTNGLSERIRWQDISLNVIGGTITGVSVDGFDSYSFNPTTGLVNGFKQRVSWPVPEPDPEQVLFVTHGRFII